METTTTPRTPSSLRELSRAECLALLGTRYVGRIAHVVGDRAVVVPVNYRVEADGTIAFATFAGQKLDAARAGRRLTLQVDDVEDELAKAAWSVLVSGRPVLHEGDEARRRARQLRLRPWAGGEPDALVRIRPDVVEGRRLRGRAEGAA